MTAELLPDFLNYSAAHVAQLDDGQWLAAPACPARQVYWCVCCQRPILVDGDGLYIHDSGVKHPIVQFFNPEEIPQ